MYNIKIEENIYLKKFFKHNLKFENLIVDNINHVLPMLITDKPHKIKTAHGYKYNNLTIYEYKIKLDNYTNCRVAYTCDKDNNILVFFISNIIIKRDFVKLLESVRGVHK
ncbi:MAG: hypothetical protein ACRCTZ_23975 [Sarcina sp.]